MSNIDKFNSAYFEYHGGSVKTTDDYATIC